MHSLSAECCRRGWPGFVPRCRRALPRSAKALLLSFTLVLQARVAPFLRLPLLGAFSCSLSPSQARSLEICNIEPGDCAAVCSRSASLHLATELLSARGRASACSGPCCESSSGSSALSVHFDHLLKNSLTSHRQEVSRVSALHLRRLAGRSRCACPHSIWDISLVEFERQVLSHCNHTLLIQLGVPVSGYRAETRSRLSLVQIHSFTILLFSLIVLLRDVSPSSSETSNRIRP